MDEILAIGGIVLAAVVLVLIGVVINQRHRLKRFEAKLGVGGIGLTVELNDLVKREVARLSLSAVARMAELDRRLIDAWERGHLMTPEQGAERLSLIQQEVATLETALTNAAEEEKAQIAMQLRELYTKLLTHARRYYASSPSYLQIREAVVVGLKRIGALAAHDVA